MVSHTFNKLHYLLLLLSQGQHHAICLEDSGSVYALGRSEYGRLGLGEEEKEDAVTPTTIPRMKDCVEVACGTAVSYAVTRAGKCFSWGMGTNGQLGEIIRN